MTPFEELGMRCMELSIIFANDLTGGHHIWIIKCTTKNMDTLTLLGNENQSLEDCVKTMIKHPKLPK